MFFCLSENVMGSWHLWWPQGLHKEAAGTLPREIWVEDHSNLFCLQAYIAHNINFVKVMFFLFCVVFFLNHIIIMFIMTTVQINPCNSIFCHQLSAHLILIVYIRVIVLMSSKLHKPNQCVSWSELIHRTCISWPLLLSSPLHKMERDQLCWAECKQTDLKTPFLPNSWSCWRV